MRVVVCLKVVRTNLVYPNGDRGESFTINPYDYAALVDCLKIKESHGWEVICLSMGSLATKDALLKILALGTDQVILLSDSKFSGADTVATSRVLSEAISKIGNVDIVICGEKSVDGETGQVGFGVAEYLKLPCVSKVSKIIYNEGNRVLSERRDNSYVQKISSKTPFLISYVEFKLVKSDVSLLSLKKARKKGIAIWDLEDLAIDPKLCGIKGSKTRVWRIEKEKTEKEKTTIEGTISDKVDFLMKKLTTERIQHE